MKTKQWTAPTNADMPSAHGFSLEDDLQHICDELLKDLDVVIIVRKKLGEPVDSYTSMIPQAAINMSVEYIQNRVKVLSRQLDAARKEATNLWHQHNPDLMGR